jgi:hypothetical protein
VGRDVPSIGAMAISVIVRAVEQALRSGRLAGEVEIVATGEKTVVRDATELVEFLRGPSDTTEERSGSAS